MLYNIPLLLKRFHWHTKFEGIVLGILKFFNGKVSVDVFENFIVDSFFQELSNEK